MLATSSSYPWWFIVVFVLGAGGLGAAVWRVLRGATALIAILRVLTGEKGGKGRREVKPLVDVVDGLVAVQELQGDQLGAMQTDMAAIRDEITCNGGNTNKIGDRVVRSERRLQRLEAAAGTTPPS